MHFYNYINFTLFIFNFSLFSCEMQLYKPSDPRAVSSDEKKNG